MTELEFNSLAVQGYNRIPLIAEALADLETPLSLIPTMLPTIIQGLGQFSNTLQ